MPQKVDDKNTELTRYIESVKASEAKPIPNDDIVVTPSSNTEPEGKKTPENDTYNEYENDDRDPLEDKSMDDKDW